MTARKSTWREGPTPDHQRPQRGHLRQAIVHEVALGQVRGIGRRDVEEALRDQERRPTIAKSVGSLVSKGMLRECLTLNGEAVGLKGRAYVSVCVDIEGLRKDAMAAPALPLEHGSGSQAETGGHSKEIAREVARLLDSGLVSGERLVDQQELIASIVERTEKRSRTLNLDRAPPVVLVEANIVHSADFDLLLSVMYRDAQDLMDYVRDVIQMTKHVRSTQTIFVSMSARAAARGRGVARAASRIRGSSTDQDAAGATPDHDDNDPGAR